MSKIRAVFVVSISFLLFGAVTSCDKPKEGACVWAGQRCWDNKTSGSCSQLNGVFYEGSTCEELGFYTGSVSSIIISEILYRETKSGVQLEWVELYNASNHSIDLTEFLLLIGDAGDAFSEIRLAGVVESCSVFLVGGPDSNESNGYPIYDQVANLEYKHSNTSSNGHFISLFGTRAHLNSNVPLSAVFFGNVDDCFWDVCDCDVNVSHLPEVSSGSSYERIKWPESVWKTQSEPNPNQVSLKR